MRRHVLPLLLAVDVALGCLLAWQWVTPQGQLRDVRWVPPLPVRPVLTDGSPPSWSADLGGFIGSLDRPLFSATRKPPVKPEVAAAVVVADTLADVRVLGLYSFGDAGGGAIVRTQGRVQRLRQGDSLGGWTVKQIRPLELVLARGADLRTLEIKRGPDVGPDTPAGSPAAAAAGGVGSSQQRQQQAQQDADNSKAAVNALRARTGMPLIP